MTSGEATIENNICSGATIENNICSEDQPPALQSHNNSNIGCCADCYNESLKICCDDCAKGVIREIAVRHGILLQTLESAADYDEDPAWFREHVIEISNLLTNANWSGGGGVVSGGLDSDIRSQNYGGWGNRKTERHQSELSLHRQTAALIQSIHEREQLHKKPDRCCVVQ